MPHLSFDSKLFADRIEIEWHQSEIAYAIVSARMRLV